MKTTHCIDCGIIRDSEFRGNRCHHDYKLYQNHYYKNNKEAVDKKNKENKISKKSLQPPKPPKVKKSKEQQKQENRDRNMRNFHKKRAKKESVRPPVKRNTDREIYVSNKTWSYDHTYYMNLDAVKDMPMECFEAEYWRKEEPKNQKDSSLDIKRVLQKVLHILRG
jgi:hypothetical protein